MNQGFLPLCKQDMLDRGWDSVDFVYVIGDAYVDHPSFGHAVISRVLEAHGYRVGIISQPDWKQSVSIAEYGEPRLAFLVSAGNMDSMVNHYSVSKKRRRQDAYTPGGVTGKRPDYAAVVYSNLIRQTYKETPIILGGIEASLRRLAHYDYWSDKVKRSILLDAGADMISYGMGERTIVEIAEALDAGMAIEDLTYLDGTVVKTKSLDFVYDACVLPSFEEVKEAQKLMLRAFIPNIKIQTHFQENVWQNPTAAIFMLCRTLRPNLWTRLIWMTSMDFPICVPAIPPMRRQEGCRQYRKSNSA